MLRSFDRSLLLWPLAATVYPFALLKYKFDARRPGRGEAAEMSMNDPQWGKRGGKNGEGPPDLNEILDKLNRKLSSLFGNTGGSGGGNNNAGGSGRLGMSGGVGLVPWLAAFLRVDLGVFTMQGGSG